MLLAFFVRALRRSGVESAATLLPTEVFMRRPALSVVFGLLLAMPLGGSPPTPQSLPGFHKVERPMSLALDPSVSFPRKAANPERLQEEAAELARLAAGIPAQIQSVNAKLLPKDLNSQLKRIEKLAKHLRSEVSQ